ncbi:amidase family protein [Streptomyces carpaticus]|uniref:amidase family protein n=1 Tax=Streptomyces carpaticus TaxID=285558 RepID=UPI0021FA7086|nr:amidase family protein [Streptomyces carpaticus]
MTADPRFPPLAVLAGRLRSGEVTSVELVRETLERIAREPGVNAVVEADGAAALRAAAEADRRLRLDPSGAGPLHGVPVTVKRTWRVRGFAHHAPDLAAEAEPGVPATADAVAVARLRAAGAVVLGRTNAPPRAADIDTWHPRYGRTPHPHVAALSPGGSSGGSAAAVAAGHSVLDLGSDVAGSARIPAHLCGLYTLRPTQGAVPVHGHVPGPRGALDTTEMLTAAPLTRSPEDLATVWRVLGGPAAGGGAPGRESRPLAVPAGDGGPLEPAVAARLERAHGLIADAGYRLEAVELPVGVEENWLLCQQLLYAEDALETATGEPPLDMGPVTESSEPVEIAWWSAGMSHRDWLRLHHRRLAVQERWRRFFRRYAALLLPVTALARLPRRDHAVPLLADTTEIGDVEVPVFSLSRWCAPASVAGLPAAVLPLGATGADPAVGLQLVGGHGQEAGLLSLLTAFEAITGPAAARREAGA